MHACDRGMEPAANVQGQHPVGRVPQVQHGRLNPCEKVLNVSNVGNFVLKWSYTTGGRVLTSPAVEWGGVCWL
jgi:hypothetical protein